MSKGEDVVFYSTNKFKKLIMSKGIKFGKYPDVEGMFSWGIEETVSNMNEGISRVFKIYSRHYSNEHKQFEEFVTQECLSQKADYVFYDYFDGYWGKVGAQKARVPAFASVTTFAICNSFFQQYAAECLQYIWRVPTDEFLDENEGNAYSIVKLVQRKCRVIFKEKTMNLFEYGNSDYINIVHTPRGLQPHADLFDDRFLFIGTTTKDNRDGSVSPPPFYIIDGRPLIYISLGTNEISADIQFFTMCIKAFTDTEYQVIMAIGQFIEVQSLGPIPSNFTVMRHAPQLEILDYATVFLTHGGCNSVNEAIAKCVPMIVIPRMTDAFAVAHQVELLKLGVTMNYDELTAEKLRSCVKEIETEPQYRQNLQTFYHDNYAQDGLQLAVDRILSIKTELGIHE